jgi:hypothetical protein
MTDFPRLRPVSNLRTSRCTSGTGTVRRVLNDLFRSLGASLPLIKGGISILINKREKVLIPIEAKTEEDDNASMKRTNRSNPFCAGLTIDRGIVPPDDITPIHSVVML